MMIGKFSLPNNETKSHSSRSLNGEHVCMQTDCHLFISGAYPHLKVQPFIAHLIQRIAILSSS